MKMNEIRRRSVEWKEEMKEVEEVLSKALVEAKIAFFKSLEDGNWDIPVAYVFKASLLSNDDFKTILVTVSIDNIERKVDWAD